MVDVIVKDAHLTSSQVQELLNRDGGLECTCSPYILSAWVDFKQDRLIATVLLLTAECGEGEQRQESFHVVTVPLQYFRGGTTKPDFYTFKIEDFGHAVSFGPYEASSESICYEGGVPEVVKYVNNLNIRYLKELLAKISKFRMHDDIMEPLEHTLSFGEMSSLNRLSERHKDELKRHVELAKDRLSDASEPA